MTSLVIVESPAKCSKIQGFLGSGWRVIATMGHIRALEEDLDAVGLDRDFEPRYAFLKDKSKAIAGLKAAAKDATKVFLASDDDREGEAISYSVAILLGLDPKTTPRIVFHEITERAIKDAIAAPRVIDMNRVQAQQARAVLDMMVGFTISPLLWKFVSGGGLSAGRCQTPALRIVADREADIREFRAETSWAVQGTWKAPSGATFEAGLVDALEDEESATNFLENIHEETEGMVTAAITRPTSEAAPKPLITSTLQQEASALYGSQPKNTMRIAQRLYEAGHITYMRTDHPVLSEEARAAAEAVVRQTYGEAYIGTAIVPTVAPAPDAKKPKKKTGAAADYPQAQEAHEAIRPTHMETKELPADEDWNAVDRKLYRLIWNRTVQSVMAPCRGEERSVRFIATGDPGEFEWMAVWKRMTFAGWKKVGQALADLDEEGTTTAEGLGAAPIGAWTLGTSLEPGMFIYWTTLSAHPKETKAPGRYTEATLVRELEKRGIGRPSTFAALVGTILDKGYVEKRDTPAREMSVRSLHIPSPGAWPPTTQLQTKKVGAEKQKLAPTPLGQSALDFCLREFGQLFDYGFTKQMEDRLDRVARGEEAWKELCRTTWGSYKDKYSELKKTPAAAAGASRQTTFAGGIKAVVGKKGPVLLIEGATKEETVFYGWPEGVDFKELTEEVAVRHVAAAKAAKEAAVLGDFEGSPMVRQSGPYGAYVVCGDVNVPWKEGDTAETIREKLVAKRASVLHTLGSFEFRTGPYGVYMFKKDVAAKARKFVSVPSGLDPKVLTLEAATRIYQNGLQAKAKAKAYSTSGPAKAYGAAGTKNTNWKKK